jgi:glutamyl-tRNA synthetase
VGGARTALFNWLWARKNKGTFLLRIEDTDVERSTQASVDQILESFQWLGIDFDEGPFYQSQRLHLYQAAVQRLADEGKIYPAFETKEELEQIRNEMMEQKSTRVYDRRALKLSADEVKARMAAGEPFVWRFKTPDNGFTDVPETLMGEESCRFENSAIDDFIITRPGTLQEPGWPLYNFCVVVDDADMRITHVIRGVEHLSNTAKQVLLYNALGYTVPQFTHLPLIMKGGKKMSKRDADADPRFPVSVSARRDIGYLKEATVNFIALLGWSHPTGEEIFPLDQLIKNFSLDRLTKANANFDEDKFLHINGWYIRNLPKADIIERVKPFLERAGLVRSDRDDAWLAGIIEQVIERVTLLSDFPAALEYFFKAPDSYDAKGVKKAFADPEIAGHLRALAEKLSTIPAWEKEPLEAEVRAFGEGSGLGFGKIAQPVRLATTGRTASPGLFDVIYLLGRDETVERLKKAAELVERGAVPTAG